MLKHLRPEIYCDLLEPSRPMNDIGRFIYEDPEHPRLKKLREQENLDKVVAGAKDDFERLVKLRNWVATQWNFGTPRPYPPWDAVTILNWIRSGKTQGWCGIYAIVFAQAAISLGYQNIRFIELGQENNPICHFLTEVWHPGQKKWAILDPVQSMGGTFSRHGIYLNALEMHNARVTGDTEGVQYNPPPEANPSARRHKTLESWIKAYYMFRVVWRQDFLSNPPPFWSLNNTFDRYYDCVEWYDPRVVQWEDSKATLFEDCPPHRPITQRRCSDASLLYPVVG